MPQTEQIRLIF